MTQVFVLGAGTPTPTAHRFGSAYAVKLGDEYATDVDRDALTLSGGLAVSRDPAER